MMHKIFPILVGLLVLTIPLAGSRAVAQEAVSRVTLFSFYTEKFPQLSAYLDVHDPQGNFVHGLQAANVQMLEDTIPVPVDKLDEVHPGVQLVVAVAPGATFDTRDANGVTVFDYLRQGIYAWGYAEDFDDDLSLVTPWSSEIAHVTEPTSIQAGLATYQPLGNQMYPDLQILSRALELVSNPTPRPGMERAILFITAPQATEGLVGLQSLADRANGLGVRIYVWVLGTAQFFASADSSPLRAVAGQTGGQFFAFTGSEAVPDLEEILEPLRHIYQLSYTSRLTTSGSHQVSAEIALEGESISSNAQTIDMTLLPPQPVFVSPPTDIEREVPSEQSEPQTDVGVVELLPVEQNLEVMVNFPDGYTRPLVRTTLYVDGAIAGENTTEPFEQFTWDLRSYQESGKHQLQVEAVDTLGLSGRSVEISVQISVPPLERNILAALLRSKYLISGLVALIAGAVLILVLILGGKIRPAHPAQVRRPNGNKNPSTRPRTKDPVTQPVSIAPVPPPAASSKSGPTLKDRLQESQRKNPTKPLAYLTPLAEAGEATLPAALPLDSEEVTLGRDPFQATVILDDPSVEAVHAILRWEKDTYHLVDNGGVAGTWVNYAEVGPGGVKLEHGDLIYAGQVGFRFNLKNPGRLPKPYIRPYP